MPWITFTRDVPNGSGEALYVSGYQADVSEKTAQKWVSSGDAVRGQVAVKPKLVRTAAEVRVPAKGGSK